MCSAKKSGCGYNPLDCPEPFHHAGLHETPKEEFFNDWRSYTHDKDQHQPIDWSIRDAIKDPALRRAGISEWNWQRGNDKRGHNPPRERTGKPEADVQPSKADAEVIPKRAGSTTAADEDARAHQTGP